MTRLSIHSFRWWDPFGYLLALLRSCIAESIKVLDLKTGSRVLDFGCGSRPYQSLLPSECEYVGADMAGNPHAHLTLDSAGRVPVTDASFDLVLSTQVLEHVDDPAVYLRECLRVLRPGSKLLLTTHGLMFFHPHPRDLWRWTADGLRTTVEQAGLRVVSVEGVMGLVPTAIWLMGRQLSASLPWGLSHSLATICSLTMFISDRLTSDESRIRDACLYVMVAEHPLQGSKAASS